MSASWGSAVAALVVAVAVSCGTSASDTSSKTTTSTTEAETTTTTQPRADEETAELAAISVYAAEDFPDPWVLEAEAEPYATEGTKPEACTNPADGAYADLPIGAVAGGPIMQQGEDLIFVRSQAAVFEDEGAASAWSAYTVTDEYAECVRASVEQSNAPDEGTFEVKVATPPEQLERVGTYGIERSVLLEFLAEGELTAQLYIETVRVGRVLITSQVDVGGVEVDKLEAAFLTESDVANQVIARSATAQGIDRPTPAAGPAG